MAMKEKYLKAREDYKITVENWNTCIDKNVNLPDYAWDKLLKEMEEAHAIMESAWREYMHKEILA